MPFCLSLPRDLYDGMLAQAKTEFPLECCGLLAGTLAPADPTGTAGTIGIVHGRYPLLNAAKSGTLFESDPRSMLDACRDIDRRGWQILAVYHSHPTSAPIPSKTDLERNNYPDAMSLIISLQHAEPLVRGWWLAVDRYHEASWTIEDQVRKD